MSEVSVPSQARSRPPQLPRNALEIELVQIWWEVLDTDKVGVLDSFFDLGGDSFRAVKLLEAIEKRFERRLPLSSMVDSNTIAAQAELLRAQDVVALWRSLVPLSPGSGPPVACAAAAHGHILQYRPLARYVGMGRPFYALQPPGLDGTASLLLSVEALASHYLRELRALHPDGPYVLVGYSFGGLVAYEMAQQANRSGMAVPLLVLLDTHRPTPGRFLERHLSELAALGPRAGMAYLWEKARGRLGKALRAEKRARKARQGQAVRLEGRQQEMQEVSDEAGRRYRAQRYAGRVLIVEGDRPCAHLWRGLLAGPVEVHAIACHHFKLLGEPHVRRVAEVVREALEPGGS